MRVQDMHAEGEGFRPTRSEVDDFLREQVLGHLTTLDRYGGPMAATVAFSLTHEGALLVGTSESSRKSKNLEWQSRVAVVVTDPERRQTVQLEGTARKIAQAAFESSYADHHYAQRPESLPFRDEPGQTHLLITPHHICYSDCSVHPWVVTEFGS